MTIIRVGIHNNKSKTIMIDKPADEIRMADILAIGVRGHIIGWVDVDEEARQSREHLSASRERIESLKTERDDLRSIVVWKENTIRADSITIIEQIRKIEDIQRDRDEIIAFNKQLVQDVNESDRKRDKRIKEQKTIITEKSALIDELFVNLHNCKYDKGQLRAYTDKFEDILAEKQDKIELKDAALVATREAIDTSHKLAEHYREEIKSLEADVQDISVNYKGHNKRLKERLEAEEGEVARLRFIVGTEHRHNTELLSTINKQRVTIDQLKSTRELDLAEIREYKRTIGNLECDLGIYKTKDVANTHHIAELGKVLALHVESSKVLTEVVRIVGIDIPPSYKIDRLADLLVDYLDAHKNTPTKPSQTLSKAENATLKTIRQNNGIRKVISKHGVVEVFVYERDVSNGDDPQ